MSNSTDTLGYCHPDTKWLLQIEGWVLTGTLSFRTKYLDIQNDKVKDLFSRLNYHMNGEYNWKNIPAYWRWESDTSDRIHCHFAMLDAHPEFHYLRGVENTFSNRHDLAKWLKKSWLHGVSHYAPYESNGWLTYITKPNPFMNSCFAPPVAYLKRKVTEQETTGSKPAKKVSFEFQSGFVEVKP